MRLRQTAPMTVKTRTIGRAWRLFQGLFLLSCLATRSICQDSRARIESLYNEADSAERGGDLNAAIEKYQAILKLDSSLPAAYNNLGRLYFRQSRFTDAIDVLKHALQLDPSLESSHALMGISLYETESYSLARRELGEA